MGPYLLKVQKYKSWVAIYKFFSSHPTALLACQGYDAKMFVVSHGRFCNTYGVLKTVGVDHGPNLVAAIERPDWQVVAKASGWS